MGMLNMLTGADNTKFMLASVPPGEIRNFERSSNDS